MEASPCIPTSVFYQKFDIQKTQNELAVMIPLRNHSRQCFCSPEAKFLKIKCYVTPFTFIHAFLPCALVSVFYLTLASQHGLGSN